MPQKVIIIAFLIISVKCDWYHHSKAFDIHSDNINQEIGKEKHAIIDFFTPWCIWCQYMYPEWNKVYENYHNENSTRDDILIAKTNCGDPKNHQLCQNFHVHSFPTILYVAANQTRPSQIYRGERTSKEFIAWIDQITPPPPPKKPKKDPLKEKQQIDKEELVEKSQKNQRSSKVVNKTELNEQKEKIKKDIEAKEKELQISQTELGEQQTKLEKCEKTISFTETINLSNILCLNQDITLQEVQLKILMKEIEISQLRFKNKEKLQRINYISKNQFLFFLSGILSTLIFTMIYKYFRAS